MMKWLWGGMLLLGFFCGMLTGEASTLLNSLTGGAAEAVTLSITLAGAYILWMGLMKIGERAGLIRGLSRLIQPVLRRLFPDSPEAVAPITLNLAANFFGMGSAATPFGLAAMQKLEQYNQKPGVATRDMCMFLSLNAAALELLPTSVLALRTAAGSTDVYCVVVPTFLASLAAFFTAILACKVLGRK